MVPEKGYTWLKYKQTYVCKEYGICTGVKGKFGIK